LTHNSSNQIGGLRLKSAATTKPLGNFAAHWLFWVENNNEEGVECLVSLFALTML